MNVNSSRRPTVVLVALTIALLLFIYETVGTQTVQTNNPRNRRPFDILYDPEADPNIARPATIDIIAVHGLGSNVDRTWAWVRPGHPGESVHWLKDADMLPSKVPTARIITFNYDSTWVSDAPKTRVELCGETLIHSLHSFRQDLDRPMIFVAHSFGGLVVQDGLIFAATERQFQYILPSIAGFVSLGTPFRGTHVYWAADLVAKAMSVFSSHRGILSSLVYDSSQLRDKAQRLGRLRKIHPFPVFCFFEVFETSFIRLSSISKLCRGIVVTEASACISGDERLQLQSDHIGLNKYSGPEDRSYLSVSAEIVKMYKNARTFINNGVLGNEHQRKGHWMVPFERNEGFVGREDTMHGVLNRIAPRKVKDKCQRTILEGLGGVGKTQIALEAAFRLRELNPSCSVFWVPAMDESRFTNAYNSIADRLGIQLHEGESVTTKVKEALSNTNMGEWLLIIDNADDPKLLFNPGRLVAYLPSSPHGSILFTTRTSEITSSLDAPSVGTFVINAMSKEEATALMYTKLSASQMEDTQSLDSLIQVLACLPLALKQAASYMQKTKITPSEYLQLCQSSDESFLKLLTKGFIDRTRHEESDYKGQAENAVARTWLISFEHVRRLDPVAGEILEFLCFLSEKDIPIFILPPKYKDLELQEAIGVLRSYAFITTSEDGQCLDMHRLVRLATQNWLEENRTFVQAYDPVLLRLGELLLQCKLEEHGRLRKLMPHVQSVVNNNNRSKNLLARFRILYAFSLVLYLESKFKVAIGFIREAEMIGLKCLHESHTEIVDARDLLSRLLQSSGHTGEASEIIRRNLRISQQKGGEVVPETLRCAVNQASTMLHSDPAEVETILQETLESQIRILGEEHKDTIVTKQYLAICLRELSRYEESEGITRQMLRTQLIEPGEKSLVTTATMLSLSTTLVLQGQFHEAEQLARRSYLITTTLVGTESRFTYASLLGLTGVLFAAGKYQEAEVELRSSLKVKESIPQGEQPERLSCMITLGYCLIRLAKYRDAEHILQKAKERCLSLYGEEHEETIACVRLLQILQDISN